MSFNVTITNIGKLDQAQIRIGQFTVLAGPNNTGKSTVSKLLYSAFDAMNANHALSYFRELARPLKERLTIFPLRPREDKPAEYRPPWAFLVEGLHAMEAGIRDCQKDHVEELDAAMPRLRGMIGDMLTEYRETKTEIERTMAELYIDDDELADFHEECVALEDDLRQLADALRDLSGVNVVFEGLKQELHHNFLLNFQVPDLASLLTNPQTNGELAIDKVASYQIAHDKLSFNVKFGGLHRLQAYSRVLYLESPLYWRLKGALQRSRYAPRFFYRSDQVTLLGVPDYVYDLFAALDDTQPIRDMPFPEVHKSLTETMQGCLVLSKMGELSFAEAHRHTPLAMTAMGVVDLGIIPLLLERRVLDAGTFLFIDEPESCLHPAWQHRMADALLTLARGGVHVVIATHSPDIIKWLAVHLRTHPDDQTLVAVNRFPVGSHDPTSSPLAMLEQILNDLTEPYASKYFEGV